MKKGFTLIEIIACLVIITLISTISIVMFKEDKDDEYIKVVTEVQTAADVYFNSNQELNKKLQDNFGYLVLTMEELNNIGILDKNSVYNKFSKIKKYYEDDPNLYEKLVVVDEKLAYGIEEGGITILYPYIEATKKIYVDLNPITIEFHEKDFFECSWGLNDNKVKYLDENYNVKELTYKCDADTIKDATTSGSVDVEYMFYDSNNNEIDRETRNITINPEYYPTVQVIFNDGTIENINNIIDNKWYNKKVSKIELLDETRENNPNISESKIKINSNEYNWYKDDDAIYKNDFSLESDGNYEINFELTLEGKYNKDAKKDINITKSFKIDTEAPTIDLSNLSNVRFIDDGSGIDKYVYSNTPLTSDELEEKWQSYPNNRNRCTYSRDSLGNITGTYCYTEEIPIDISDETKDHYLYVKDKAGNMNSESIVNSMYPIVTVTSDSISEFNINIKSSSNIQSISLKWKYGSYESNITPSIENINNAINEKGEYTKKIDMTDLYIGCADSRKCYSNSWPTVDNLNMTFFLEITNQEKSRTYTINATQNVKVDHAYSFSIYNDYFYINDNNDILYGYHANPTKSYGYESGSWNVYNSSNSNKTFLGYSIPSISSMKYVGDNFYLISFDNEYVEYALCGDSPSYSSRYPNTIFHSYYYTRYRVNIKTGEKTTLESSSNNSKLCTKLLAQGEIKNNGTYETLENSYKYTIDKFIRRYYSWNKDKNNDSDQYMIQYIPDIFSGKMFRVNVNNKNYYSTMIYTKRESVNRAKKSVYDRVLFYPKVTLSIRHN